MHNLTDHAWPSGADFLHLIEAAADSTGQLTDRQREACGKKYPLTLDNLGTLLSLLYRAACCGWGCRGGNHQAEWLVGRTVNQAMASYRLVRAAFYDESLMLTRGLGEIANLLWLFRDPSEFERWRTASRTVRLKDFSPRAVRRKLEDALDIGPPISDDRYRQLCEVGSHPVPWTGPNLFSGGTRPVLGHVFQPAGLMIAINELSFAIALAAAPVGQFLELQEDAATELKASCRALLKSVGGVAIDAYSKIISERVRDAAAADSR